VLDGNIYTRRWWLNFATHRYDGWNLWWAADLKGCRLAFATIAFGPRNKKSNAECFELDKRYGRKYI
jgi:hypothetical protein